MKILYLGDGEPNSTSFHRAAALRRLGHDVVIEDIFKKVFKTRNSKYYQFNYHTGFTFLQRKIKKFIDDLIARTPKPDLIWINSGELFNIKCLMALKSFGSPLVLYNNDDPTGKRDGNRFKLLRKAIPYYDLAVVMRNINVSEFYNLGAKKVLRVFMSYDEVAHRPFENADDISTWYKSDVAFLGTWMRNEQRDNFMIELVKAGIPISIWGERWQKSPNWQILKPFHRGEALSGRDYVAAIQGSKICLGLLSKGNRDEHTQRSLEIPFIGGLFCAERTSEHQYLYTEGKEALFWSGAKECAEICKSILQDEPRAAAIRQAGSLKIRSFKMGNEDVCSTILETAFSVSGSKNLSEFLSFSTSA